MITFDEVKKIENPFFIDDVGFYENVFWALRAGRCPWCGAILTTNDYDIEKAVLSIECEFCEWGLSTEIPTELIKKSAAGV